MSKTILSTAFAFIVGAIFALGLALSGMLIPAKVQAFLDLSALWRGGIDWRGVAGFWDPSLGLVIGAAIPVSTLAYRWLRPNKNPLHTPLLDTQFHLPTASHIDVRLVGGSVLFGAGWATTGYCPGPAIGSIGIDGESALPFLAASLVAMAAVRLLDARKNS